MHRHFVLALPVEVRAGDGHRLRCVAAGELDDGDLPMQVEPDKVTGHAALVVADERLVGGGEGLFAGVAGDVVPASGDAAQVGDQPAP